MKITLKDGSVFEGTAEEYAELAKLVEGLSETKDEYVPKVGDKVRALTESQFLDIKEGEVGTVKDVDASDDGCDEFKIEVSTAKTFCYFRPQDLEKVGEGDVPKFEVGDYVVALPTADERYSITNSEMRLGKVKDVQGDLINIEILEHSRSKAFVGEELSALSKYFRKATEEEKKQYNQAGKFAKLGRKPGEFKKGDIVRVKWLLGKGYVDEIAEIKSGPEGVGCGGNYKLNDGNKETLGEDLELIAPVESRVDRVD